MIPANETVVIIGAITGLLAAFLSGMAAIISAIGLLISHMNALAVKDVAKDIKTIEINTNSLTEKLVRETADAKFAEGVLQQKNLTEAKS